ncbi:MAG: hypothetical protein QME61_03650 [Patescibacteria group bacterium]|nr:hypothetical protein [Patescibacteria group bacterium]
MKIVICASLDFTYEIKKIADQLNKQGYEVTIPKTSEVILNGKVSLEQIKREREAGQISKRTKKYTIIKYYFEKIKDADAILVLNYDRKGIKNYIGGNTFAEMAVAFYLGKPIYLINPIPEELIYTDEIKAMEPIILNGNLDLINQL